MDVPPISRYARYGPPSVRIVPNKFVISTGESRDSGPPLPGDAALHFVISTEAQRSGEISVLMLSVLGMFWTGEVMGLRPTQGSENRLMSGNRSLEALPSPLSSRPKRSVGERSAVLLFPLTQTVQSFFTHHRLPTFFRFACILAHGVSVSHPAIDKNLAVSTSLPRNSAGL
jgi:hypothetical protein